MVLWRSGHHGRNSCSSMLLHWISVQSPLILSGIWPSQGSFQTIYRLAIEAQWSWPQIYRYHCYHKSVTLSWWNLAKAQRYMGCRSLNCSSCLGSCLPWTHQEACFKGRIWTRWRAIHCMGGNNTDQEVFVALDESAVDGHTGQRKYGCSWIGNPCIKRMSFLWGIHYSILLALTADGIIAPT